MTVAGDPNPINSPNLRVWHSTVTAISSSSTLKTAVFRNFFSYLTHAVSSTPENEARERLIFSVVDLALYRVCGQSSVEDTAACSNLCESAAPYSITLEFLNDSK